MNETSVDWTDLRLFLEVARHGGLTAAARRAGTSPPTLGRRMIALEARLGYRLFDRYAKGYELTSKGLELLDRARHVEAAVRDIERWRDSGAEGETVLISAGTWMTRFLASHIGVLVMPDDRFRLALQVADQKLDIARREVSIGIRNKPPSEAWLAGRKIGSVAFAPYVRADRCRSAAWIIADLVTPSAQWVRERHGHRAVVETNAARTMLDLALTGLGHVVLPCFVGDSEPELVRSGDPIEELRHEQWLVAHHEERHQPATRRVLERLARLISSEQRLFRGLIDAS